MEENKQEQSGKYWIVAIVVLIIVLIVIFSVRNNDKKNAVVDPAPVEEKEKSLTEKMNAEKPATDEAIREIAKKDALEMLKKEYSYEGTIGDVAGGEATGVSKARHDAGVYELAVTTENLSDPEEGYFYEGWVVRKEPFHFISTNKLEKVDGQYVNTYQSGEDLTDHTMYVVTLEPDDNNPEPADHILEGNMEKVGE